MPGLFSSLMGSIEGAPIQSEVNDLLNTGNLAQEYGFGTFAPMAQQGLGQAQNYYSGILSGNLSDITKAMAPEISTIQQQGAQQAKNLAEFTPQGGGQTQALSQIPFTTSGQETNLISQAQQGAAQGMAGLAGEELNAVTGLGNLSAGAFSQALQGLLGKQSQATQGQMGGAELGLAASGGMDPAMLAAMA